MTIPPVREAADADLDEILVHNNAAVPAVNALTRGELEWFLREAHSFLVVDAPDGSIARSVADRALLPRARRRTMCPILPGVDVNSPRGAP